MADQEPTNAPAASAESPAAEPALDPALEVTADDHDNGYKDVAVQFKSGRAQTIRLTAIPGRRAVLLLPVVIEKKDPWRVLLESLPPEIEDGEKFLDQLSPFSSSPLLGVAWALAFGSEFQKKTQKLGEDWLNVMTARASVAANSS